MYRKNITEICNEFRSNKTTGLSDEQYIENYKKYGKNEISIEKNKSIVKLFLLNFCDWLVVILLIAALISVLVDPTDYFESLVILFVLVLNATINTTQEMKTAKSLEELKKLTQMKVKVLRNHNHQLVDSTTLVPGDIIFLRKGDILSCDARLIETNNLEVDESAITGESISVYKDSSIITYPCTMSEQKNMLFSSSNIVKGSAKAVVVSTAMNSTIGQLAKNLKEHKILSPLQIKLNQLAKIIGILCIAICAVVFILEVMVSSDYLSALKSAIALSVAAVPEGLTCIVTLILTIGVNRMAKENVVVKKLDKVETLGSVNIICTDKTGTLTENKMKLTSIYTNNLYSVDNLPIDAKRVLYYAKMATNYDDLDPTDNSIITCANKFSVPSYKLLKIIPFDSTSKMLKVVVEINGRKFLIVKGALDYLEKYNKTKTKKWSSANNQLGYDGLRVLALGIKEVSKIDIDITGIEIIGLLGIKDNLRPMIKESVDEAETAGVRTIMITGDHLSTATAIAKEAHILKDNQKAITSQTLNQMTEEQLMSQLHEISVYARMTPFDKLKVIEAWQKENNVVAMTGDGVNDSIALNKSNCGIALGSGCDVSKEAASLIIVDDNYQSIVKGIKHGRCVYDNILKCIKYLLSSNIGEVLAILLVAIISIISSVNYGVTLMPIHLLFINLITDSLPAFALGLEKPSSNIMKLQPKKLTDPVINIKTGLYIAFNGLVIAAITVCAFFIGFEENSIKGMTMAFVTLSLAQLIHAYNCKSTNSIINKHTFNNKTLNLSFLIGVTITLMVVYLPLNSLFKLTILSTKNIITILILILFPIISSEFCKTYKNNISKLKK